MTAMDTATVTTPMPPIWIIKRITACPKRDQYLCVSCTTSPVTQVAEVAVNKASAKGVTSPLLDETGSISKILPVSITSKKPAMISWDEVNLFLLYRKNPMTFCHLSLYVLI